MLMRPEVQRALFATMDEQGMDDHDQHDFLRSMLPGITSFKYVTTRQAMLLLDALNTPHVTS